MVLFILSAVSEVFALVGASSAGISVYYGAYNTLNIIAIVLLVLDIIISVVFVYSLLKLKNVLLWTDVALGFATLRGIFSICADVISNKGTAGANIVELVIILVVWFLFRKHLKKVLSAGHN